MIFLAKIKLSLKNNFAKYHHVYLLVGIIILGLMLRLFKLQYAIIETDEGRDLLVASHIAEFGENLTIGHFASGFGGYNPPYYYYILAFLTTIFTSPFTIYIFVTIWHALSGILIYLIGKNIFNQNVGLYSALFYSISTTIILSSGIWSAYTSFLIFIISFYYFSLYYLFRRKIDHIIHVILLILSISIQYSLILTLPIFAVWSYLIKGNDKPVHLIKMFFLYAFTFLLFQAPTIIYHYEELFNLTQNSNIAFSESAWLPHFAQIVNDFTNSLFTTNSSITLLILAIIITVNLRFFKDHIVSNQNILLVFVSIPYVLVSSTVMSNVYSHYLYALYIFAFLSLAILVDKSLHLSKFLSLALLLQIIYSLGIPTDKYSIYYQFNSLQESNSVANSIESTIHELSIINPAKELDIIQNAPHTTNEFYPGPEYYLFLEHKLNMKLVDIIQGTVFNILPKKNASYIILICRKHVIFEFDPSACFDAYLGHIRSQFHLVKQIYQTDTAQAWIFQRSELSSYY